MIKRRPEVVNKVAYDIRQSWWQWRRSPNARYVKDTFRFNRRMHKFRRDAVLPLFLQLFKMFACALRFCEAAVQSCHSAHDEQFTRSTQGPSAVVAFGDRVVVADATGKL